MADRTALAVVQEAWEKWVAGNLEGMAKMAQLVFEVSEGTLKASGRRHNQPGCDAASRGAKRQDPVLNVFTNQHEVDAFYK